MKIKELQLDESQLDKFIAENLAVCKSSKGKVIAEVKGIVKHIRKEIGNAEDSETSVEEANHLSGVATFLKKSSILKLMALAVLSKKSLKAKFNSTDALEKERAVYLFASHESIKPLVLNFRSQYPRWKEAKALLKTKTQENKNKELAKENGNEAHKEEKVKNDKATVKKSLKRKSTKMELGENYENCPVPKRKKKKLASLTNGSVNTKSSPKSEDNEECASFPLQNGNFMQSNGNKEVTDSENSSSDAMDSHQESDSPRKPRHWQHNRGGKFSRGGRFRGRGGHRDKNWHSGRGERNWRGGYGSRRNNRPPMQMKFGGKDNPNNIDVPADWQNKAVKADGEDGAKPSLLRPMWLTNPEEYKPPPLKFNGQRNFRGRREPANPNSIRVSNDWKNKGAVAAKSEEGQTSLLRPSWLTNPQSEPTTNFNRRPRGNFRKFRKY